MTETRIGKGPPPGVPADAHFYRLLGAILATGYLGGAVFAHLRVGSPLFGFTLFGVYLGAVMWTGLWLRDPRARALI